MALQQNNSKAPRILVVEDELDLQELIALNLRKADFLVDCAGDGRSALEMAQKNPPHVVVLDVMLPGMLGTQVAAALRSDPATARASILMLTAKSQEADQVAGLEAGADDYVTKPFSMKVLVARVQALLRRNPPVPADAPPIRLGAIEVNPHTHRVTAAGSRLELTLTEYKILLALLQSPEKVLSRADLIGRVMGHGIVITPRTIDVHVAAIRRKLAAADPIAGKMIQTSRGIGYSITAAPDESMIAE